MTCVQLHKTSHTKDNFSINVKYNFVYCGKLQNYGVRFFLWKKMLCSKAYQYAILKKKMPIDEKNYVHENCTSYIAQDNYIG